MVDFAIMTKCFAEVLSTAASTATTQRGNREASKCASHTAEQGLFTSAKPQFRWRFVACGALACLLTSPWMSQHDIQASRRPAVCRQSETSQQPPTRSWVSRCTLTPFSTSSLNSTCMSCKTACGCWGEPCWACSRFAGPSLQAYGPAASFCLWSP